MSATAPELEALPVGGLDPALVEELRQALSPGVTILRELSRGGMGLVLLGREVALKRLVVIKVLAPELAADATARARFRREAETAAMVAHPNVVAVYRVGELPRSGTSYLVMQFIDGPSLAEEFPNGAVAPGNRVRRIVGEVASALAAAHARDLIHRDIKPANIMLDRNTGRAVVLDFGITAVRAPATPLSPRITQEGMALGTPLYMSPEQAATEPATGKSDIYSLGLVGFELACGHPPFDERTPIALAAAHLHKIPAPVSQLRPDLDPELARLLDQCLAKDPAARPSAADISRALIPSATSAIEWPPPGLERLQGTARTILRRCRWVLAAVFAYFLVETWIGAALPGAGWMLWTATILGITMGAGWSGGRIGARSIQLGLNGRQAGYPLHVLLDVALDRPEDGGALYGGTGMFALVPDDERRSWFERRRWSAVLLAAGAGLTAIVVVSWLLGWIPTRGDTTTQALGTRDAIALFAPWFLAEGAGALLRLAEWRRRLTIAMRPGERSSRFRSPAIRHDLAKAWLAEAGMPVRSPHRRSVAVGLRAAAEFWVLPMVALVAVPVVLAWGAIWSPQHYSSADPETFTQWMKREGPPHAGRTPWQATIAVLDSTLRGWGDPTADSAAIALFRRHALPSGYGRPWPEQGSPADFQAASVALFLLPGTLPPTLLVRLRRDASAEGLASFRRLLRAPAGTVRWEINASDLRIADVPLRGALNTYGWRNLASGAVALAAGDRTVAAERGRETLALARLLLSAPDRQLVALGRQWASNATTLQRDIALAGGDPRAAAQSEGLAVQLAADNAPEREVPWAGAELAAATGDSATWSSLIADRALAPMNRRLLLNALVMGTCRNQREKIEGPRPWRVAVAGQAGAMLADLPEGASIAAAARRVLGDLEHPGQKIFGVGTGSGNPLALIIRPIYCAADPGF